MTQNETQSKLKIIPLGGLHEIGKNTCVFEYEDEIILVDAGLGFPTEGMHGVNIVLPDMTYLQENRHKIQGMIVTHGHEDHIGGLPYHLKHFDIPIIYAPRLAAALLRDKLAEAGLLNRTTIQTVSPRETVRLGQYFAVEYIRNTHSMADSFTVAITTPLGVIIHTGDFKIDHSPVDKEYFDLQKLAEYGEKGVLCLLSDSTNSEVPGFTPSESSVYPHLDRVFAQAPGRLMLTTFSSSVHRIHLVLQLAQKHNRKVVVVGRSMLNLIAHARNLGYIKCPDSIFESVKAIKSLPDEKILILSTGSQGETLAGMTRIAKGMHPQIRIKQGDTIIFSANPIPGNTIAVVNIIDQLMMQGANVVYGRDKGVHVSGHGAQEDQKLMLALTKPKFFMPVHGEHRMLVKHSQTAQSLGIPPENMVIVRNGDIVGLSPDSISVIGQVTSGVELVDQAGVVHEHVMEDRRQLADDGVVTIAAAISTDGKLLTQPSIDLRGVVTNVERSLLNQLIIRSIERTVTEKWEEYTQSSNPEAQLAQLREEMETNLKRLIKRELQSQPLVIFLLQTTSTKDTSNPARVYHRRRPTASIAS